MQPKTILITGCGRQSVGSAMAKEFCSRWGHTVFASSLNVSDIDPSLAEAGCHVLELDVTSTESIDKAVHFVVAHTRTATDEGRLDILINNAGVLHIMPFIDTPVEHARRVFEVNTLGPWAVTRAFLPLLMAAGRASNGDAKVANLCSVNEVLCPPFLAAYNSSKAALESINRTLRRELAPLGVKVIALKCGCIDTGLFTSGDVTMSGETCPEGSPYFGLRDWIARREFMRSARYANKETVAKELVQHLLTKNTSAVIWKGGLATMHWLISLGWETMMVSMPLAPIHLVPCASSGSRAAYELAR